MEGRKPLLNPFYSIGASSKGVTTNPRELLATRELA